MALTTRAHAATMTLLGFAVVGIAVAGTPKLPFPLKATATNSAMLGGQFVQSPVKVPIPVTDSVRIDVSEFIRDFEKHYDVYQGAQPTAIQVVMTGGKYRLAWQPRTTEFVLGPATLSPLPGEPPFHGFSKGAEGMIIIGRERAKGPDTVMNPMWIAMFEVREDAR